jgi:DNA-binding MarR family transcriptional regulator
MYNVYRKILEGLNEKDQAEFVRSFETLFELVQKIEAI